MVELKCIVKYCSNRRSGGTFEGPICVPCITALGGGTSTASAKRILKSIVQQLVR